MTRHHHRLCRRGAAVAGAAIVAAMLAHPGLAWADHFEQRHFHHVHDRVFLGFGTGFYDPWDPWYPYYYYPPPPPPPPRVVYAEPPTVIRVKPALSGEQNCREYQTTITVEGKTQPAYGRVCRQPDGTWRLQP